MKFLKKLFSKSSKSKPRDLHQNAEPKEDWTTYKRYKDNAFWIVIVNRGLMQNNQVISMSWYTIEYRFLQRELINGMFPKSELSELYYGFEDNISAEIAEIGGQLAATQTGFGTRRVWFCAPSLLLEAVVRTAAKTFTSFPVDVSPASFLQFEVLMPTDLESQWAGNEKILQNLSENGDDGSEPRSVMHWAYGTNPDSISKLAERLEREGYVIEEQTGEKVMFSRFSVLTEDQSKMETTKLTEICEVFSCEYDGWETPVVKLTLH
jgi:hypothetical protein